MHVERNLNVKIEYLSISTVMSSIATKALLTTVNRRSHSVAVITSALHAEGPQFDPG